MARNAAPFLQQHFLPSPAFVISQHNRLCNRIRPRRIRIPNVPISPALKPAVPSLNVNPIEIRVERHRNARRILIRPAISGAREHAVLDTPGRYSGDVHIVVAVLEMVAPARGAEPEARLAGGDGVRLVVDVGTVEGEEALVGDGRWRRDGISRVAGGACHFGA